jgi:hypothetical protein
MRLRLFAALLGLLTVGAPAGVAESPRPAVTLAHTERIALTAAKTGRHYELLVSLPEDYAAGGRRYPVLYVLDGWHFPLLAFLQNNNRYSGRMGPVIMVNIGHVPAAEAMRLRSIDFTPTPMPRWPEGGHAADFLEFLEHEVLPLIERTYHADPADRGLLGHSLGGLFALYALIERPGLFQRIVSASPAADWDDRALFRLAREKLQGLPAPVRLALSAGDEPDVFGHDITGSTADFAALLTQLKVAHLEFSHTHFPGENHNSIRLVSFPSALYWVYRQ